MRKRLLALLALLALSATFARAEDGATILAKRCGGCHNLTGPAAGTLKELWARKAPDLFYAGNKYRTEWLRAWLRKPARLRPAGEFYAEHLRTGEKSDEVDLGSVAPHPALLPIDADAVAAALMRLKPHDALIAAEKIEPGTISRSMGEMAFDKFMGCMACHEIEPGFGGASGPELYTAGRRLQPEFIASYIRSPQAWDPKIWMPNKRVSDANIQKMVRYLAALSQEEPGDAK